MIRWCIVVAHHALDRQDFVPNTLMDTEYAQFESLSRVNQVFELCINSVLMMMWRENSKTEECIEKRDIEVEGINSQE